VVQPTAERVVRHLRAAHVLGTSRAMARNPQAAAQQAGIGVEELRQYSEIVGTQEALNMVKGLQEDLHAMAAAPAQAKLHVAAAFKLHRATKDFDKPGKNH
jgi:hypothetical protein